jgi:phage tail-like protein
MSEFPEILASSRFYLELHLDGSEYPVDAYFQECQGFKRTQKSIDIYEVTAQKWGKANHGRIVQTKIPGNVESSNLILKRGITKSMTLWNWFKAVEEGDWEKQRRNGTLTIYDLKLQGMVKFEFQRAWPISYKIGDVGMSKAETEIEEIELAVESLVRTPPESPPPASPAL